MQVEPTRMYRVKDVAGHFDVSAATIYRAIESGQLVALKLGSNGAGGGVGGVGLRHNVRAVRIGTASYTNPMTDPAGQPQVSAAGVGR